MDVRTLCGAGRVPSVDAPAEGARIDGRGSPAGRDSLRGQFCVPFSQLRERQVAASAKPLGHDAFDVAMAREDDSSRGSLLCHWCIRIAWRADIGDIR